MNIPAKENAKMNECDNLGSLVVEAQVTGCLVQQSNVVVRVSQPVVKMVIFVGWEDAKIGNPEQTGLTWLKGSLNAAAEPKQLRECRREDATKAMPMSEFPRWYPPVIKRYLQLLAPLFAFLGRIESHEADAT
jgi:hypothetical protein